MKKRTKKQGNGRTKEVYLKNGNGIFRICGDFVIEEIQPLEIGPSGIKKALTEATKNIAGMTFLFMLFVLWILIVYSIIRLIS